jgi:hypothetical protein
MKPKFHRIVLLTTLLCIRVPARASDGAGDRVVAAQVTFDTTHDDKDADTSVVACLVYDPGSVSRKTYDVGCTAPLYGRRFADQTREGSWNVPVTWTGYTTGTGEQIFVRPNRIRVRIRPSGHDTWRFRVYARWRVQNGDAYEATSGEFNLDQDHAETTMVLTGNALP